MRNGRVRGLQIRQMKAEELDGMRERLGQMGTVISALWSQSATEPDDVPLAAAQQSSADPGSKVVQQGPQQQLGRAYWPMLERQLHAYLDLLQQRSSLLTQVPF